MTAPDSLLTALHLHQAAAVVGPAPGAANAYGPVSGVTLYRVTDGRIDDGTFLAMDPGG